MYPPSEQTAVIGGPLHLDRGVWDAPYTDRHGSSFIALILEGGIRVAEIRIPHGIDKALIERHARALLDALDPPSRPALTLVPRD